MLARRLGWAPEETKWEYPGRYGDVIRLKGGQDVADIVRRKVCAQPRTPIAETEQRYMKSLALRILVCGLATGLTLEAALPQTDDELAARTMIMALENIWNNAEKRGDAAAFRLILHAAMGD